MFSKTALAAVAGLSFMLASTATPNMALAAQDTGQQICAPEKKKSGKKVVKKTTKKTVVKKSSGGKVVKRTTTTRVAGNQRRHVDRRVVTRTTSQAYVLIGTPVVYRAYGRGWCRALHRGCHWSPGIGRHCGRHVGRVKC